MGSIVYVSTPFRKYLGLRYTQRWSKYFLMPQGFLNNPAIFTPFMSRIMRNDVRTAYCMNDIFGFNLSSVELRRILEDPPQLN